MSTDDPGYLYAIVNPAWPGWVKVGLVTSASNAATASPEALIRNRVVGLNVSDPFKSFRSMHYRYAACAVSAERFAHTLLSIHHRRGEGEWFKCPLSTAVDIIDKSCRVASLRPVDRHDSFARLTTETIAADHPAVAADSVGAMSRTGSLDANNVVDLFEEASRIISLLLQVAKPGERLRSTAEDIVRQLNLIAETKSEGT